MNRIVVYTSKTGFTEKYAKWIAEELNCNAVELKRTNLASLSDYDQVIYGGWIMANNVSGYDKVKDLNLKNLIVFASGMSIPNEEVVANIVKQSGVPKEKFHYFEGGFAPSRVGLFGKMAIKMIAKSIEKKENKTQDDYHLLETTKGADRTSKDAIKPLVAQAR